MSERVPPTQAFVYRSSPDYVDLTQVVPFLHKDCAQFLTSPSERYACCHATQLLARQGPSTQSPTGRMLPEEHQDSEVHHIIQRSYRMYTKED